MEKFDATKVLLNECKNCQFIAECFGPRENGCRRFPETITEMIAEQTENTNKE